MTCKRWRNDSVKGKEKYSWKSSRFKWTKTEENDGVKCGDNCNRSRNIMYPTNPSIAKIAAMLVAVFHFGVCALPTTPPPQTQPDSIHSNAGSSHHDSNSETYDHQPMAIVPRHTNGSPSAADLDDKTYIFQWRLPEGVPSLSGDHAKVERTDRTPNWPEFESSLPSLLEEFESWNILKLPPQGTAISVVYDHTIRVFSRSGNLFCDPQVQVYLDPQDAAPAGKKRIAFVLITRWLWNMGYAYVEMELKQIDGRYEIRWTSNMQLLHILQKLGEVHHGLQCLSACIGERA
ncbi:hypothetical protein EV361DRAFT_1036395 [Lentinula raphanica]|nr:hypothetical protein EV361DRAFT_1036395 [Lentinula raphanica]